MEYRPSILVVDDDQGVRDTLSLILKKHHRVATAPDGETALELLEGNTFDVVLLDIRLPGLDGLEVLRRIKESQDQVEVIMITVVREIETAVRAIKLGAYDYVTKEFNYEAVENLVQRALEKKALQREVSYLHSEIEELTERELIMGLSPQMEDVGAVVEKTARLPTTVLISGESGTGKELVARFIHLKSDRATRPFVTVNLAAIPTYLAESTLFGHERGAFTGAYKRHIGKFELAHGGTLFLDEVGDLDLNLQAKLLRAVQEGEIERVGGTQQIPLDVRLIVATKSNLEEAVKRGDFREDLFYRLNVIPLKLPPLRERLIDVPLLVELFIERYNRAFHKKIEGMTPRALQLLTEYSWPGNIRELENVIERLVALADGPLIDEADLPLDLSISAAEPDRSGDLPLKHALEAFERNFIVRALDRCGGSRTRAAEALGVSLSTLKYKMNKLGIYELLRRRKEKGAGGVDED